MFNIVSPFMPFESQCLMVLQHFNQLFEIEKLVAACRDARPSVKEFSLLAPRVGLIAVPKQDAFEVFVRKGPQPFMDVAAFLLKLTTWQAAVCMVVTDNSSGTGTLVANDIVLTNYHVVKPVLRADGTLTSPITCLFDKKTTASGTDVVPELPVQVSKVLAFSPYADEDLTASAISSDPCRLDYALLQLESPIGNAPIITGGDLRGFIQVPAAPAPLDVGSGLLVLQHPLGESMKIDLGSATLTGTTRLRHNVNTSHGSSGAPVFDAGLNLVAIHHAGYNWPAYTHPVNQAIPTSLIKADANARGVAI